jgi:hypothetical protein
MREVRLNPAKYLVEEGGAKLSLKVGFVYAPAALYPGRKNPQLHL